MSIIWKHILSYIQKNLPGWILKKWFPSSRCKDSIDILPDGIGPHIYINPERSPGISNLGVHVLNRLPFEIELLSFTQIEILLEDKALLSIQYTANLPIEPFGLRKLIIPVIQLTDGQARIVRDYPANCPILKINCTAHFKTPVSNLKKNFSIETRASIFEGRQR